MSHDQRAAGLTPINYHARLARVCHELGANALVVMSQPPAVRNSSVEHRYRQESFFYWLTGFPEPHAALVVLPFKPQGEQVVLFLRQKDPERELWDGRRLGVEQAPKQLPVDRALPITQLWECLPELLSEAEGVFFAFGMDDQYDRHFIQALNAQKSRFGKQRLSARLPVYDSMHLAGRVRLRKEPEEIERMRFAADVTRKAYDKVFASVRPGMNERDVHAILLSEFLTQGGEMEAYDSIVASGINACILHYHDNNGPLVDGDLLLIDAGAQAHYYATDVTRTFPVGKIFSPEQRLIYELTLAAQKAAIAKAVQGSSLGAVHDEVVSQLVDGLCHLGFLRQSKDEILSKHLYKRYFPHGTSHWIGMDVHDVGIYREAGAFIPLEAGMYFSVEPGIYIDPADESVPAGFRGIGVRIEDDVLVTSNGNEVLTEAIPKELQELEGRRAW